MRSCSPPRAVHPPRLGHAECVFFIRHHFGKLEIPSIDQNVQNHHLHQWCLTKYGLLVCQVPSHASEPFFRAVPATLNYHFNQYQSESLHGNKRHLQPKLLGNRGICIVDLVELLAETRVKLCLLLASFATNGRTEQRKMF